MLLLLLGGAGVATLSAPTITIDQGATAAVGAGALLQLTASVTGNPAPTIVWSSDNTAVATVNASTGLVTGVAAGACTITAEATNSEGVASDTLALSVTAAVAGAGAPRRPPRTGVWLPPGTGVVLPTVPVRPVQALALPFGSEVVEVTSAAQALAMATVRVAALGSIMVRVQPWSGAEADPVWNPTEAQLRNILLAMKLS